MPPRIPPVVAPTNLYEGIEGSLVRGCQRADTEKTEKKRLRESRASRDPLRDLIARLRSAGRACTLLGVGPVSETVSALGEWGLSGKTVVVTPGVPRQVDVTAPGAEGFLEEASSPLTVAWTVRGPEGLAFAQASHVVGHDPE